MQSDISFSRIQNWQHYFLGLPVAHRDSLLRILLQKRFRQISTNLVHSVEWDGGYALFDADLLVQVPRRNLDRLVFLHLRAELLQSLFGVVAGDERLFERDLASLRVFQSVLDLI